MQSSPKGISQNLLMLIGGFETTTGEQVSLSVSSSAQTHKCLLDLQQDR